MIKMGLNLAGTFYLWVSCNQLFYHFFFFFFISPSVACSSLPGSGFSVLYEVNSIFFKKIGCPGASVCLCCNLFIHNCIKCAVLFLKVQVQETDKSIMLYFGYRCLTNVRFNDSWFVFHDSSWSFHEPYFSKKHLFHEPKRVNRSQEYGLKKPP